LSPAKQSIENLNLELPNNFAISVFAKNLPGARVMVQDKNNNIWLSQTSDGKIAKITIKNGRYEKQETVLEGLKNPHGLAFDPENSNALYIAEENKISKTIITATGVGALEYNEIFGSDGKMYISDDKSGVIYSVEYLK
jgi:glucose/arabinose dehydrogenase